MISIYETLIQPAQIDYLAENAEPAPELSKYMKEKAVQRLIKLSQRELAGKATKKDKAEIKTLFDDKKIKEYLAASQKVGERNGWINGGIFGAAIGSLAGLVIFPPLALLGAIAGGVAVGYPASKLSGILRKWQTEEKITKGGLSSGAVLKL